MKKSEVKGIIKEEKELYLSPISKFKIIPKITHHKRYIIWRYLSYFRLAQYYYTLSHNKSANKIKRIFAKIIYFYYLTKKNIYSEKSGVEIGQHCNLGRRLDIWHSGVHINTNIGDDCVFHGHNFVGNKGMGREAELPNVGNHVDVYAGAKIVGNVNIADYCKVGANAVVTKSFTEPGSVLVGVPAKAVVKKDK